MSVCDRYLFSGIGYFRQQLNAKEVFSMTEQLASIFGLAIHAQFRRMLQFEVACTLPRCPQLLQRLVVLVIFQICR